MMPPVRMMASGLTREAKLAFVYDISSDIDDRVGGQVFGDVNSNDALLDN